MDLLLTCLLTETLLVTLFQILRLAPPALYLRLGSLDCDWLAVGGRVLARWEKSKKFYGFMPFEIQHTQTHWLTQTCTHTETPSELTGPHSTTKGGALCSTTLTLPYLPSLLQPPNHSPEVVPHLVPHRWQHHQRHQHTGKARLWQGP